MNVKDENNNELWMEKISTEDIRSKNREEEEDIEENEEMRFRLVSEKSHRFIRHGKGWYCDECRCEIRTYDLHFHCFECADYDLCQKCYENGKGTHLHDEENFFYEVKEPHADFSFRLLRLVDEISPSKLLIRCFRNFSDRHFLGTRLPEEKRFSWLKYSEVFELVTTLFSGMHSILKLRRGDLISLLTGVRLEPVLVWFSCMYSGVGFVPLQSILSVSDKKMVLQQTEVKVMFCEEEMIEEFLEISKECPNLKKVVLISSNTSVPFTKIDTPPLLKKYQEELKEVREKMKKLGNINKNIKLFLFSDLLGNRNKNLGSQKKKKKKKKKKKIPKPIEYRKEDIVTIIFTSGTTGTPKGIVFRDRRWIKEICRQNFTVPHINHCLLTFSHLSGILDVFVPFFNGGRVALLTQSDMSYFLEDFQILRPTTLSTVPRILNFIYSEYQRRIKDIMESDEEEIQKVREDMRYILGDRLIEITVGSAPTSFEVKRCVRKILQIPIRDGYGISEVGGITHGFQKTPGVETKLVDCPSLGYFTTDKPYPRGELLVKTYKTEYLEYFKNESLTRSKVDENGFFRTGDIVELREKNKIVVIDRKNNILKLSQGEFISLEHIENVLIQSRFVEEIVLFPSPDKSFLVGLVSPSSETGGGGEEEEETFRDILQISRKNQLNTWEIPKRIALVFDKFQLTELGKKNRKRIREKYHDLVLEMVDLKDSINLSSDDTENERGSAEIEIFLSNLGIGFDRELHVTRNPNTTLRDLGIESFSVLLLKNLIEKKTRKAWTFSDVSSMALSKLISSFSEGEESEGEEEEEDEQIFDGRKKNKLGGYIDFDYEYLKFENFMNTEMIFASGLEKGRKKISISSFSKWVAKPRRIFVTGGSGFLGQSILRVLVKKYPDSKVICLVRSSNSNLSERFGCNVETVIGDLSKPYFGYNNEEEFSLQFLRTNIDLVFHIGAMVNHFADYDDHYPTNVRSLYDLMRITKGVKPFIYVSTLSVFFHKNENEEDLSKQLIPFSAGYVGSKWMVDCLLQKFFSSSNYTKNFFQSVMIIRPNFLLGDVEDEGRCNLKDWMCRIIKACKDSKSIPNKPGRNSKVEIDMLSVNFLADSLMMMIPEMSNYENMKNQKNISFENLSIQEFLDLVFQAAKEVVEEEWVKVTFDKWLENVKKLGVNHPISPFVEKFQRSGGIIGTKEFVEIRTNIKKEKRQKWRKVELKDVEKFLRYISDRSK